MLVAARFHVLRRLVLAENVQVCQSDSDVTHCAGTTARSVASAIIATSLEANEQQLQDLGPVLRCWA